MKKFHLSVHKYKLAHPNASQAEIEAYALAKVTGKSTTAASVPTPGKKPCVTKVCRLGNRACDRYWSCRDTCRDAGERITNMKTCPKT